MERDGWFPCLQEPTTGPYPEPDESNSHPIPYFPEFHFGLLSGLSHSGFPMKTVYLFLISPMRATCPAHFIPIDLITLTISGEEYKLWIFSFLSQKRLLLLLLFYYYYYSFYFRFSRMTKYTFYKDVWKL
jgi:hypothetical protein